MTAQLLRQPGGFEGFGLMSQSRGPRAHLPVAKGRRHGEALRIDFRFPPPREMRPDEHPVAAIEQLLVFPAERRRFPTVLNFRATSSVPRHLSPVRPRARVDDAISGPPRSSSASMSRRFQASDLAPDHLHVLLRHRPRSISRDRRFPCKAVLLVQSCYRATPSGTLAPFYWAVTPPSPRPRSRSGNSPRPRRGRGLRWRSRVARPGALSAERSRSTHRPSPVPRASRRGRS